MNRTYIHQLNAILNIHDPNLITGIVWSAGGRRSFGALVAVFVIMASVAVILLSEPSVDLMLVHAGDIGPGYRFREQRRNDKVL